MSDLDFTNIPAKCQIPLNSLLYYQKLQALPRNQRWLILAALFIVAQMIVFGSLYRLFGKVALIGFFASILAGFATSIGALPAVFLNRFPVMSITACSAVRREPCLQHAFLLNSSKHRV